VKYMLFAGPKYYPGGGVYDYVGRYQSVDAAKAAFAALEDCNDWAQIVDAETIDLVEWYGSGMYRGESPGWRGPR